MFILTTATKVHWNQVAVKCSRTRLTCRFRSHTQIWNLTVWKQTLKTEVTIRPTTNFQTCLQCSVSEVMMAPPIFPVNISSARFLSHTPPCGRHLSGRKDWSADSDRLPASRPVAGSRWPSSRPRKQRNAAMKFGLSISQRGCCCCCCYDAPADSKNSLLDLFFFVQCITMPNDVALLLDCQNHSRTPSLHLLWSSSALQLPPLVLHRWPPQCF